MRFLKSGPRYINLDAITDACFTASSGPNEPCQIQVWSHGGAPPTTLYGEGAEKIKAFLEKQIPKEFQDIEKAVTA